VIVPPRIVASSVSLQDHVGAAKARKLTRPGVLASYRNDRTARAMRIVVNLEQDLLLEWPQLDRLANITSLWNAAVLLDPPDISLSPGLFLGCLFLG